MLDLANHVGGRWGRVLGPLVGPSSTQPACGAAHVGAKLTRPATVHARSSAWLAAPIGTQWKRYLAHFPFSYHLNSVALPSKTLLASGVWGYDVCVPASVARGRRSEDNAPVVPAGACEAAAALKTAVHESLREDQQLEN